MTRRPKVGDVFVVPVDDGRAAVGQIVGGFGRNAYYFAIFDSVMPIDIATSRAAETATAPVLFLALSMDAKLHAGHWLIVGQAPVSAHIPLPAFKESVGSPTQFEVVDYSGTRRRPATRTEADALPNRKVVAPVRLEKALRASLGMEPWLETFDELRPEGRITTADLFD